VGDAGGPLRILVVATNASERWGGEAVLPLHIFRELRRAGHEVWLCVGSETRAELDELLGVDASRVAYVEDTGTHRLTRWLQSRTPRWFTSHPYYFLQVLSTQARQRREVLKLVEEHRIDVVHQPTPVSPRAPSFLTGLPVPLVIGPMNGGMEYPPGFAFMEPWRKRTAKKLGRAVAGLLNWIVAGKRQSACLLVANQRTRAALPAGARGRVVEMVENGVDPGLWSRGEAAARADRGGSRPLELVFIGRLERWKGAEWLVEAVARATRRVDCRLRIVGDLDGERQRLAQRVADLGAEGRIELLGWQPQARCAELLGAADALVLPSVYECGGAVVLEAMAAGKAVVAVDWGGPGDYIDARCGVLLEPRGPANLVSDLEEAIVGLATDRARCAQLGRAGREKVLVEYSWPRKAERLVDLYRSLGVGAGR
jgi:glycosyltransferase involved in cell wall biosynthesis